MKKLISFVLVFVVIFVTVACSRVQYTEESSVKETNSISQQEFNEIEFDVLIPNSYCKFTGLSTNDLAESFTIIGSDSVRSFQIIEEDVIITVTQKQINDLIKRINDNIASFIMSFEKSNENYRFVGSDDYTLMEFYCDEKIDSMSLYVATSAISSAYALNNILYEKDPDWGDVILKVVNCHTGKTVVEANLLNDKFSINQEAWEKSYVS